MIRGEPWCLRPSDFTDDDRDELEVSVHDTAPAPFNPDDDPWDARIPYRLVTIPPAPRVPSLGVRLAVARLLEAAAARVRGR